MAKEWILNSATNRFQLNFKRNVGAVSEAIRRCAPKTIDEWRGYYFRNVRDRAHIEELGRKLYVKITEVVASEIDAVTERDCIDYVLNLVIDRTYDGYETEIRTVYGQLERLLGCAIEAAPDEWDRLYNVDFFARAGKNFVGIQIKPVSGASHISQIHKERALQKKTHARFRQKFGGDVFYVFSEKQNGEKVIQNPEVAEQIKREIARLK
ncbi:MAG: MjaI family restriction endonuclease [Gammaproteobacteria bacterium]